MEEEHKGLVFRVHSTSGSGLSGEVQIENKPGMRITLPPKFGGDAGILNPEDLLLSSLASCYMLTFLYLARSGHVLFESYKGEVKGILAQERGIYGFSWITMKITVRVKREKHVKRVNRLLKMVDNYCPVYNVLKVKPEIEIKVELIV